MSCTMPVSVLCLTQKIEALHEWAKGIVPSTASDRSDLAHIIGVCASFERYYTAAEIFLHPARHLVGTKSPSECASLGCLDG